MGEPAVTYSPRPDTTQEGELNALAAVYRFDRECRERKGGGPAITAPDNPKERTEYDFRAADNCTESSGHPQLGA